MPTYEYQCSNCQHQFEVFQSIKDKPLRKCPECGKNAVQRLISTGGGVIFKGSGFWQTDYRSESYKKSAGADKPAEGSSSSTETKSEAKPAESTPKPESKPQKKGA